MMIGDDHVDPEFGRGAHYFAGADAGVDADDEFHALRRRVLHHVAAHAVAVAEAMRDVKSHVSAQQLDPFFQNDDGGGAVDVVIAIQAEWARFV